MTTQYDLLLVGAGLANGLIALRLKQLQPAIRILIVDAEPQAGGNHTWCFHAADLTQPQQEWIAPLVEHRWPCYEVRFPDFRRRLQSSYMCVTSSRFNQVIQAELGTSLRLNTDVISVAPDHIILAGGETLTAGAVIDGRGYQPDPALHTGFQAFLGQQWRLRHPHHLQGPILMDATVNQQDGYRFVYTLPLSPTHLLIEDTHYIDNATLSLSQARLNIAGYAALQGWELNALEREERGSLPITLSGDPAAFWRQRLPSCGLRAGLFHPTTGYSLPLAVAMADLLAARDDLSARSLASVIPDFAHNVWRRQGFFRILNRMLFLAGDPAQRWRVMQRFYRLPDGLIHRFYAGQLSLIDRLRILSGKPPVPLLPAMQAIFTHPSGRRASR